MTTLRRELRKTFEEILSKFSDKLPLPEREPLAESLADAALELRGFKTDEERPVYGLDWVLGHDQEVNAQDFDRAKAAAEAPVMFEKAFRFGTLPWSSNRTWIKFQDFVTEIYIKDRFAFGNYVIWRGGEGKFRAMNNKQIRMNPQVFIDTGWAEFAGVGDVEEQDKADRGKYISGEFADYIEH